MKKFMFRTLCVLTALSVLCTCYVIYDYLTYSTNSVEKNINKLNDDIDNVQDSIDKAQEKKDNFSIENKEKSGLLEVWQKELEKVE